MSFTAPVAADLKARFASFAAVADATIDVALAEAARMVDDSWSSQEDFTLGRLLYAAHILTLDGFGTGAEAAAAAAGTSAFSEVRSGRLTLKQAAGGASEGGAGAAGTLSSTTYGRRFVELLKRNRGGPLLAKATA